MSDLSIDRREPEAAADPALGRTTMWKVSVRLLPFLFVMYVFNILDRVNVGFARLQMLKDLSFSEEVYGLGVSVFFLGYFVFEVPSNLMLRRVGARRWLARILVSWGAISAAMMFVSGPVSFYLLRFLLGLAEAGFFPGVVLYLSYWFPANERARAVSRFMTGSALTGIVGNPLSGAILQFTDGAAGLAGWQWLFLLEGIPTVALGVIALYYLTDRPEQARWLEPAERDWLAARMSGEERQRERRHGLTLLQTLSNPRIWLLCALYFTVSMGANSFGAYAPQLVSDTFAGPALPLLAATTAGLSGSPFGQGPFLAASALIPGSTAGTNTLEVGLLAAIPSLGAIVLMVVVGAHSDRTGERRWHVAGTAWLAALGWVLVGTQQAPALVLLGLTLAQMGMLSMLAPFWALPTSFLSGAAAAGGIAFINSVGNLGGFVGPNIIGQVKTFTGSFAYGMLVLAAVLALGGVLALCARHDATLERPPTVP